MAMDARSVLSAVPLISDRLPPPAETREHVSLPSALSGVLVMAVPKSLAR